MVTSRTLEIPEPQVADTKENSRSFSTARRGGGTQGRHCEIAPALSRKTFALGSLSVIWVVLRGQAPLMI